jgi:hypothetical protein
MTPAPHHAIPQKCPYLYLSIFRQCIYVCLVGAYKLKAGVGLLQTCVQVLGSATVRTSLRQALACFKLTTSASNLGHQGVRTYKFPTACKLPTTCKLAYGIEACVHTRHERRACTQGMRGVRAHNSCPPSVPTSCLA